MKKKAVIICAAILVTALIAAFVPIPMGTLEDGGTRDYKALTYRIVVWHIACDGIGEDGEPTGLYYYEKTSVYWFSDAYKTIDELRKIELGNITGD